jgi:hypothetical protein
MMPRRHLRLDILAASLAICFLTSWSWGCGSGAAQDEAKQDAPSASSTGAPNSSPSPPSDGARISGIAFVDTSVTGEGSRAQLPAGTQVYSSGSKIVGTEGCPTSQNRTDGLIVAVIDYEGRPTSAALTIVENHVDGSRRDRAPYYLDLDSGRTLQFLGPIFDNGTYDLELAYNYAQGKEKSVTASFSLARSCSDVD